ERLARLVVTGGVNGELAVPQCRASRTLTPADASRLDTWALHHQWQGTDYGSLLIDSGGLLARHGVARYAAEHAPEALAELVDRLGYAALAFGEADLGDPRALVLARARALRARGVPLLATNLRCEESAAELCEVLVTGEDGVPLHRHGDETLAVLSYLEPAAAQRVGPDRMEGLRIEPLGASIGHGVRAAREAGATVVIAIIDAGYGAGAVAAAVNAMEGLSAAEKPDLVISTEAGSQLLFARPVDFRPAFVAAPTRSAATVRVRRNLENQRLDILAQPAEPADPAPPFQSFVGRVGRSYCEALGAPLPGGRVDAEDEELGALDASGMVDLVAGTMREATQTDVALLNESAIDSRWEMAREGELTASDVNVAVQYDEPLMVAEVSAYWLRSLARANPDGLRTLGLTITDPYGLYEKVRVNGRLLDLNAMYRVVTIRFLAEGGDESLVPEAEWEPANGRRLREVLMDHLSAAREEDPRAALVDPYDRLEWTLNVNSDVTFSGSAVRDSGAYQEGPLVNQNQTQFGLNTSIGLNALSSRAAWENLLTATYTLASTATTDGFDEGADQIVYRTTGNYRGFRRDLDELYVPDLVAEGLLRTEFSRAELPEDAPEDAERPPHFLNLRFTAGVQWRLHLKVKLKLLAGFDVLAAADSDNRSVEPGVGAQINIDPWLLMKEGLRKLTLGLTMDYFVSGLGDRNRHLLQGLFDLELKLNRFFALTLNVTLYGLQEEEQDFSFATQTTAGLRITYTGRRVMR
ncbi:MAG TPA: 5'-nucleotidase C-terminal domain-containing protein, partial [Polyangiaceae bacterium LLY-WYZ-15_(1-7)]|nr:5'-nucleotidase C-terminal domain-containing protein [Polyangiaceae bacterium LLY-WYZ-15_(1-7)]